MANNNNYNALQRRAIEYADAKMVRLENERRAAEEAEDDFKYRIKAGIKSCKDLKVSQIWAAKRYLKAFRKYEMSNMKKCITFSKTDSLELKAGRILFDTPIHKYAYWLCSNGFINESELEDIIKTFDYVLSKVTPKNLKQYQGMMWIPDDKREWTLQVIKLVKFGLDLIDINEPIRSGHGHGHGRHSIDDLYDQILYGESEIDYYYVSDDYDLDTFMINCTKF